MMKTIVLVDDELIAREHIKEAFPWEEWGFRIVGEAGNGEEALTLIEALVPDIALVDITMPIMDGLTLLQKISECSLRTKCVILTAHRDFAYVKQALENGAAGYILKSPVNLAETKSAMDKALWESDKELRIRSAASHQMTIQNNRFPLRRHFFQLVLTGVYAGSDEIVQRGLEIGARLHAGSFVMIVGEADHLDAVLTRYSDSDRVLIEFSMLEMIRESLVGLSIWAELFPLEFGRVAILLGIPERAPDLEGWRTLCVRVEQALQPPLRQYLDLALKLAAGTPFAHASLMRASFRQTEELLVHRFYQDAPRMIVAHSLQPLRPMTDKQRELLDALALPLAEAQPESDDTQTRTERLLNELVRLKLQPSDVLDWLEALEQRLRLAPHLPDWPRFNEAASVYDAIRLLRGWLRLRDRVAAHSSVVRPDIARAVRHIRQHLEDELSLDKLAAISGLSTSHFGHLFKKELGKSVVDYILEQRIELAKRYLAEGKYRNYELAERAGFQHYSYFSNTFKKLTGMSPSEYKRSVRTTVVGREPETDPDRKP